MKDGDKLFFRLVTVVALASHLINALQGKDPFFPLALHLSDDDVVFLLYTSYRLHVYTVYIIVSQ